MHKLLPICIFLLCYLQIAQSYQIFQLNSEPEKDVPSLKEIIQKERNQEIEYVKNNVDASSHKRQRPRPIGKSLLVKRIIPHGYAGSEYEYDSKLNTVFKPIVRFHIQKPIAEHERDILKELEAREGNREDKDLFQKGKYRFRTEIDRFGKGKDGFNDGVIVLVKKDHRKPHDLLRQIKNYLNRNRGRPQKKIKQRFRSLLSRPNVGNKKSSLRLLEKSGEVKDPLAPGKIPEYLQNDPIETDAKPKVVIPNYSFWDFWSNSKTILQDPCRGGLVQMGNMCVNPIGHRKYLEPIKNSIHHVNPRRKSIKTVNPWKLLKSLRPEKLVSLKKKRPQKSKIIPTSPRKYRKYQYKK